MFKIQSTLVEGMREYLYSEEFNNYKKYKELVKTNQEVNENTIIVTLYYPILIGVGQLKPEQF